MAFVEPKAGAALAAGKLIARCRGLLTGYKVPREIRSNGVSKTSTGEIQKFTWRERLKSASAMG